MPAPSSRQFAMLSRALFLPLLCLIASTAHAATSASAPAAALLASDHARSSADPDVFSRMLPSMRQVLVKKKPKRGLSGEGCVKNSDCFGDRFCTKNVKICIHPTVKTCSCESKCVDGDFCTAYGFCISPIFLIFTKRISCDIPVPTIDASPNVQQTFEPQETEAAPTVPAEVVQSPDVGVVSSPIVSITVSPSPSEEPLPESSDEFEVPTVDPLFTITPTATILPSQLLATPNEPIQTPGEIVDPFVTSSPDPTEVERPDVSLPESTTEVQLPSSPEVSPQPSPVITQAPSPTLVDPNGAIGPEPTVTTQVTPGIGEELPTPVVTLTPAPEPIITAGLEPTPISGFPLSTELPQVSISPEILSPTPDGVSTPLPTADVDTPAPTFDVGTSPIVDSPPLSPTPAFSFPVSTSGPGPQPSETPDELSTGVPTETGLFPTFMISEPPIISSDEPTVTDIPDASPSPLASIAIEPIPTDEDEVGAQVTPSPDDITSVLDSSIEPVPMFSAVVTPDDIPTVIVGPIFTAVGSGPSPDLDVDGPLFPTSEGELPTPSSVVQPVQTFPFVSTPFPSDILSIPTADVEASPLITTDGPSPVLPSPTGDFELFPTASADIGVLLTPTADVTPFSVPMPTVDDEFLPLPTTDVEEPTPNVVIQPSLIPEEPEMSPLPTSTIVLSTPTLEFEPNPSSIIIVPSPTSSEVLQSSTEDAEPVLSPTAEIEPLPLSTDEDSGTPEPSPTVEDPLPTTDAQVPTPSSLVEPTQTPEVVVSPLVEATIVPLTPTPKLETTPGITTSVPSPTIFNALPTPTDEPEPFQTTEIGPQPQSTDEDGTTPNTSFEGELLASPTVDVTVSPPAELPTASVGPTLITSPAAVIPTSDLETTPGVTVSIPPTEEIPTAMATPFVLPTETSTDEPIAAETPTATSGIDVGIEPSETVGIETDPSPDGLPTAAVFETMLPGSTITPQVVPSVMVTPTLDFSVLPTAVITDEVLLSPLVFPSTDAPSTMIETSVPLIEPVPTQTPVVATPNIDVSATPTATLDLGEDLTPEITPTESATPSLSPAVPIFSPPTFSGFGLAGEPCNTDSDCFEPRICAESDPFIGRFCVHTDVDLITCGCDDFLCANGEFCTDQGICLSVFLRDSLNALPLFCCSCDNLACPRNLFCGVNGVCLVPGNGISEVLSCPIGM